jgi:hypothetical protein
MMRWLRAFPQAIHRQSALRATAPSRPTGLRRALIKVVSRPYSIVCLNDQNLDGQSSIQVAVRHDSSALGDALRVERPGHLTRANASERERDFHN